MDWIKLFWMSNIKLQDLFEDTNKRRLPRDEDEEEVPVDEIQLLLNHCRVPLRIWPNFLVVA